MSARVESTGSADSPVPSLRELQEAYFDLLVRFFWPAFERMEAADLTPHEAAEQAVNKESLVKAFVEEGPEFLSSIWDFWTDHGAALRHHLSARDTLTSVYGGDLSPSYTRNIAGAAGLYMDTIVIPDPLIKVGQAAAAADPRATLFYFTKHALNMLGYRDLALAEIDTPILVVAGPPTILDEEANSLLRVAAEVDVLDHAARVFGRSFDDVRTLDSYIATLETAEDLVGAVVEEERLLFDAEWSDPLIKQVERHWERTLPLLSPVLQSDFKLSSNSLMLGRMLQSNAILMDSEWYSGTPLIDAPTSWQYFLWKLEYDAARMKDSAPPVDEMVISNALAIAGRDDLPLLSAVPPDALIELRKEGALDDLRKLFRDGIHDLDQADPASVSEAARQLSATLSGALDEHAKSLDDLSGSGKRFFGYQIGPWIGAGGIAIAATVTGSLPLLLAATVAGMAGVPGASDLVDRAKELLRERRDLKRSPAGILFKHLD